ncbi:Cytochrome b-c1 complex subunit 2, mitochondrial [Chamberlinius hualienensis]
MPAKIPTPQVIRHLTGIRYASQAAAKPTPQKNAPLPKRETRVTTLPNGIVVASVENYSPVSRVSFAFKAGSRYETGDNLGVSHVLRNCAGLTTEGATTIGITRNIQQVGGSLSATSTREHVIYNLECVRDNVEKSIEFLRQVATKTVFKPWEVHDYDFRLKLDVALLKEQPHVLVLEKLHKVAYRNGLGNSLYTADFRIGDHEPEMLLDYVNRHFRSNRTAIVGVGICHDYLVDYAKKNINLDGGEVAHPPAKYAGGEVLVETHHPLSYVAVATEGAALKNIKDVLALGVFQHIMGVGSNIKWSDGVASQKLAQIASKATDKPFAISALNLNYSDSGLFGFYCVSHPEDTAKILKAVFSSYSALTKSGIPEAEIQRAKTQLKATLGFAQESSSSVAEEFASQALTYGQLTSLSEIYKTIDGLSSGEILTAAKKVINGKPSLAAVGNVHDIPRLDQLA